MALKSKKKNGKKGDGASTSKAAAPNEAEKKGQTEASERSNAQGANGSEGPTAKSTSKFRKPRNQILCRYFLRGTCNRGADCSFSHVIQPTYIHPSQNATVTLPKPRTAFKDLSPAQQVLGEPLCRSTILSFLDPRNADSVKAVISLHCLGLLPTEDLKHYFDTFPMPKRLHRELIKDNFGYHPELFYAILKSQISHPFPWRYAFHDEMTRQDMEDILLGDLFNDIKVTKKERSWVKSRRRTRTALLKKYKHLMYVPYEIVRMVRNTNYMLKRLKDPKLTQMSRESRQQEAGELLAMAAEVGADRSVLDELFIKHKADTENTTLHTSCMTPILLAASNGHTSTVKHLVDLGADTDAVCDVGGTLVEYAAYSGCLETLKYAYSTFADEIYPSRSSEDYGPVIISAARSGSEECVRYLLDETGLDPREAVDEIVDLNLLHGAVISGNMKLVEALVEEYDLDVHALCSRGFNAVAYASWNVQLDMIRMLVERYHVEVTSTEDRRSPLIMLEATSRSKQVIDYLEGHGASLSDPADKIRLRELMDDIYDDVFDDDDDLYHAIWGLHDMVLYEEELIWDSDDPGFDSDEYMY